MASLDLSLDFIPPDGMPFFPKERTLHEGWPGWSLTVVWSDGSQRCQGRYCHAPWQRMFLRTCLKHRMFHKYFVTANASFDWKFLKSKYDDFQGTIPFLMELFVPVASLFVISFLFCEQYQQRLEKKGTTCHPFDLFGHFLHFVLDSAVFFLELRSFAWFWILFSILILSGWSRKWTNLASRSRTSPFRSLWRHWVSIQLELTYWEETKNMIKQDNNQKETGNSFLGRYCRGVPDPKIRIFHVGC